MSKKIIGLVSLFVLVVLLSGCASKTNTNTNIQTNTNTNIQEPQQGNWKEELKSSIEDVGGTGIPRVTLIKLTNSELTIEYSSWNISGGKSPVFNEQQKITKVIVSTFKNNEVNTVNLRVISSNSYVKETYNTTLTWSELQKMSELEYSQLEWEGETKIQKEVI